MSKLKLSIEKLFKPFARALREQLHDFERPIPDKLIRTKKVQGNNISYVPWFALKRLADHYSPGWTYEVLDEGPVMFKKKITEGVKPNQKTKYIDAPHFLVKVRITIHYTHEGEIRTMFRDGTGAFPINNSGYGDPYTNAEAKALRRGWAKFGLGLSLYYPAGTYTYHELTEESPITEIVGELGDETEDERLESGYDWEIKGGLEVHEPTEEKDLKDVLASELYEVLTDAGSSSIEDSHQFAALILGHSNTTKLSRLAPEERVQVYHIASELRMTVNKVNHRAEFFSWILKNAVRIISRDGVSKAVDHWVSTKH